MAVRCGVSTIWLADISRLALVLPASQPANVIADRAQLPTIFLAFSEATEAAVRPEAPHDHYNESPSHGPRAWRVQ